MQTFGRQECPAIVQNKKKTELSNTGNQMAAGQEHKEQTEPGTQKGRQQKSKDGTTDKRGAKINRLTSKARRERQD